MNGRLQGKVALITGASTGIGEAIALKFALEGAKVALLSLPDDPVDELAERIKGGGGEALALRGDAANPDAARSAVEETVSAFGRLDVLVNNAGAYPAIAEMQEYPIEAFQEMLHNNIQSAFMMTRFALPELQKTRGNVVSAGSEAGFNGLAQNAAYGGTKGFMHAFTKGVAVEQAKHGVRANCVCPGAIDTAWTHKETSDIDGQMEEMLIQATPMGRRGTPEEMANVYAFLASDEASYVTGALWLVDGGITIAKGPVGDQVPKALKKEPEGTLNTEHALEGRTS